MHGSSHSPQRSPSRRVYQTDRDRGASLRQYMPEIVVPARCKVQGHLPAQCWEPGRSLRRALWHSARARTIARPDRPAARQTNRGQPDTASSIPTLEGSDGGRVPTSGSHMSSPAQRAVGLIGCNASTVFLWGSPTEACTGRADASVPAGLERAAVTATIGLRAVMRQRSFNADFDYQRPQPRGAILPRRTDFAGWEGWLFYTLLIVTHVVTQNGVALRSSPKPSPARVGASCWKTSISTWPPATTWP